MTAISDFITNLRNFRTSADSSAMIGDIDLFIAALQEIAGGVPPSVAGGDLSGNYPDPVVNQASGDFLIGAVNGNDAAKFVNFDRGGIQIVSKAGGNFDGFLLGTNVAGAGIFGTIEPSGVPLSTELVLKDGTTAEFADMHFRDLRLDRNLIFGVGVTRIFGDDGGNVFFVLDAGSFNSVEFQAVAGSSPAISFNGKNFIFSSDNGGGPTSDTADLKASTLTTDGFTVLTLPVGVIGNRAYVTDALAPVFGNAVVGGGAVVIPVFFDGTAWVVG